MDEAAPISPIRFQRWHRLTEATELLGKATSEDAVLAILSERARGIARSDGVTVVIRDGDEVTYIGEDAIAPLWLGMRFPIAQCISGLAMLGGEPILIPDIRRDPRVPLNAYLSTFVASMAMFPVGRVSPRVALGLYWKKTGRIEPDALSLAEALAKAAGAALERIADIATNPAERSRS